MQAWRSSLAVLVASVLIAGCGSTTHSDRPAVAHYINQVNAVEKQLAKPLQAVTSAGSQFASSQGKSVGSLTSLSGLAQRQTLERAMLQIRVLRGKLAAIPAPPAAAKLDRLLLQLIDGEAGMTHELLALVVYLPRFTKTLTSLTPATQALQAALAVSQPLGTGVAGVKAELVVKARALTRYQGRLQLVLRRLKRLHPPPVSRPQYTVQVLTLKRMSTSAGQLASALTGGNSNVAPLLRAFDTAAGGNQTVAAQRAQIAAIRAYDARATRIDDLARAVEAERARLAQNLK